MNTTGLLANLEITFWNLLIALMSRSRWVQWIVQKAYPFYENRPGMKNILKFFVLSGAVVALIFSLLFAYMASKANRPARNDSALPPGAAATDVISLPTGQRSILVVSADDLTAPKPRLLSIWLVLFLPPEPHLTLMPIYPSTTSQDISNDSSLASIFRLDPHSGRLDPAFLEALRARNFWWSASVALDQFALKQLLSALNDGSQKPGDVPSPASPAAGASQLADNPHLALLEQATWYQEMCWRVSRLDEVASLIHDKVITASLGSHIRSDISKEQALIELQGLQIPSGGLFCEFPTLSVQARATW